MTTASFSLASFNLTRETPAPAPRRLPDALRDILRRRDDRLIVDIGMTRDDILGPEEAFRQEWARIREPWQL